MISEEYNMVLEEYKIINGIKTHCYKMGKGRPVILVHGWPHPFTPDDSLPQTLAKHFTVFLFDLPGFGSSNRFRTHNRLDRFSDFIGFFIRYFRIEKPIIIAFSLGGIIALQYTVKHQKKLAGLVVCASTNTIDAVNVWVKNPARVLLWVYDNLLFARKLIKQSIKSETLIKNFWKLVEPKRDLGDKDIEQTIGSITKVKIPVVRDLLEDVLRLDLMEKCRKITIPLLMLAGEKDSIFPHKLAEKAFQSIPDATFILVPEAVHSNVINENSTQKIITFIQEKIYLTGFNI